MPIKVKQQALFTDEQLQLCIEDFRANPTTTYLHGKKWNVDPRWLYGRLCDAGLGELVVRRGAAGRPRSQVDPLQLERCAKLSAMVGGPTHCSRILGTTIPTWYSWSRGKTGMPREKLALLEKLLGEFGVL